METATRVLPDQRKVPRLRYIVPYGSGAPRVALVEEGIDGRSDVKTCSLDASLEGSREP